MAGKVVKEEKTFVYDLKFALNNNDVPFPKETGDLPVKKGEKVIGKLPTKLKGLFVLFATYVSLRDALASEYNLLYKKRKLSPSEKEELGEYRTEISLFDTMIEIIRMILAIEIKDAFPILWNNDFSYRNDWQIVIAQKKQTQPKKSSRTLN